ncbi:MAG: hypothetical protein QXS27_07220 [Candidatus Jordarchaeaceae archaeon]
MSRKDELPDYIKNRIWLKSYPEDVPHEVKIPKNKSIPDLFDESTSKKPDYVNIIFYGTDTVCFLKIIGFCLW